MTAVALPPPTVKHRRDFFAFVLADAEPWHREHLGRLYEDWQRWNDEYFDGQLEPPHVLLAAPSASRAFGDCSTVSGWGSNLQIRLRPSLLTGTHRRVREEAQFAEGRYRVVADVLLHETIHQYLTEITDQPEPSFHGHGPAFRDECNRIGALLGLGPVRSMKKRGADADLPSCAQWPHNVRPEDYYLGAYPVPDDGDTTPAPTLVDLLAALEPDERLKVLCALLERLSDEAGRELVGALNTFLDIGDAIDVALDRALSGVTSWEEA